VFLLRSFIRFFNLRGIGWDAFRHRRVEAKGDDRSEARMKRPNPLPPEHMTPAERRAEMCGLLALGLVRLQMRETGEVSDDTGERYLHYPADRCRHATPTHRRTA